MGLISRGWGQKPPNSKESERFYLHSLKKHTFSFPQWTPCFVRRAPSTLTTSPSHGMRRDFENLTATCSSPGPQADRGKSCHWKISFLLLLLLYRGDGVRNDLLEGVPTEKRLPVMCSQTRSVAQKAWKTRGRSRWVHLS